MGKKLLIIGAGGHAKVALDCAVSMNKWKEIYLLDDRLKGKEVLGYKVIGDLDYLHTIKSEEFECFVAIGNNKLREYIQKRIVSLNFTIVTLIHPSSVIGLEVSIGHGCIIMPGAVINSNTIIESGTIINTGVTIDHDNYISAFAHISPGSHLAGGVYIGKYTWVGIGCTIINQVKIGENVLIGAGTLVIRDIYSSGVYFGSPAKRIRDI